MSAHRVTSLPVSLARWVAVIAVEVSRRRISVRTRLPIASMMASTSLGMFGGEGRRGMCAFCPTPPLG